MKNFLKYMSIPVLALMVASCGEDELGPVPTVSLGSTSVSNVVGAEISTTVTYSAPEGAEKLVILKNGAPSNDFPEQSLNGAKSGEYAFTYTIESNLDAGDVVNFSFTVTDAQGRPSSVAVLSVTVSAVPPKEIVNVAAGNYTGNITWTADKIYRLNGFVRIGQDDRQSDGAGAVAPQATGVLTIEPGTLIIADRASKGTLIIHRGSQIIADGTVDAPIVFTSEREVGRREPGDWGGLVVCGFANNNVTANNNRTAELEGGYGAFHGGFGANLNNADNSGIIRYVRLEFAGVPINPNEEVNSLTMGSVGNGTVIENVMASYGLDDAFEWFGGTVNCKNLIAYRCLDDDMDVDLGYSGSVQFGLVIRGSIDADQSGSNGFEVDNNGAGSAAEPFTSGIFSNMTVIGPKATRETAISLQYEHAAQLRRNSRLRIYNSFFTGFPNGIYIDDQRGGSSVQAANDELQIRNVILAGVDGWGGNGYGSAYNANFDPAPGLPFVDGNGAARPNHPNAPRGTTLKQEATPTSPNFNVLTWFNTTAYNNKAVKAWTEVGISPSLFEAGTPNVLPSNGSMLLGAAKWDNTPLAGNFFDKTVTYIGAFGATDWTAGWANWDAQLTNYGVSN